MEPGRPGDEQLRQTVRQALEGDRRTEGLGLRVGVLNGVVSLAGVAPSVSVWRLAQAIAGGVAGVRGVANRIQAPGAPSPMRSIDLDLPHEGRPPP